ncbi:unnamed protein product, partial [Meganyctiphanes norvegica]
DQCGNFTIGDQHFLVLKNEHKNWDHARKKCEEKGLDLAEPKDYKAVVNYLDENCENDNEWWLGGKGDGSNVVTISGTALDNNDPMWLRADGSRTWDFHEASRCLYLQAHDKNKPIYTHYCQLMHKIPLCG